MSDYLHPNTLDPAVLHHLAAASGASIATAGQALDSAQHDLVALLAYVDSLTPGPGSVVPPAPEPVATADPLTCGHPKTISAAGLGSDPPTVFCKSCAAVLS